MMALFTLPDKWDYETDVIVVGGGTAGLPAAVTVAEAGLGAAILDSSRVIGGSFRMVAGSFAVAGSDEQRELGIQDSPEIFYEDIVSICGSVPQLAEAYVANQVLAYRMLKEEGIMFPAVNTQPGHSRPRGLSVGGRGTRLVKAMERRAKAKGVQILLRHRAKRLFQESQTGKILGVKVHVENEVKNFKARKAVILASGGFGRNPEMIREYAPEMVPAVPKMPTSHLGDGLRMALDVGAATKDIGSAVAPSWPVCAETHASALMGLWYGGVAVNVEGKRFHDESSAKSSYVKMTGAGMRQPGGFYWVIFNEAIMGRIEAQVKDIERCRKCKADTIEGLAKNAGLHPQGLTDTIREYNSDIEKLGYDTVFGRRFQYGSIRPLVKIDEPPFYAIKCVTSTTSMKGGLKINGACQVINNYDEVIPGLYAAGEVTGGLHTKAYLLGVLSSASFTFGIIAGRNACKEPAW